MSGPYVSFETACAVARAASVELDESTRWLAFDPDRYERAKVNAGAAFAALVDATRRERDRIYRVVPS